MALLEDVRYLLLTCGGGQCPIRPKIAPINGERVLFLGYSHRYLLLLLCDGAFERFFLWHRLQFLRLPAAGWQLRLGSGLGVSWQPVPCRFAHIVVRFLRGLSGGGCIAVDSLTEGYLLPGAIRLCGAPANPWCGRSSRSGIFGLLQPLRVNELLARL